MLNELAEAFPSTKAIASLEMKKAAGDMVFDPDEQLVEKQKVTNEEAV